MKIEMKLQGVAEQRQALQVMNAFNAPLSWLRVLKYMEELSPKTRQVSQSSQPVENTHSLYLLAVHLNVLSFIMYRNKESDIFS
jgi:hypothetical protein